MPALAIQRHTDSAAAHCPRARWRAAPMPEAGSPPACGQPGWPAERSATAQPTQLPCKRATFWDGGSCNSSVLTHITRAIKCMLPSIGVPMQAGMCPQGAPSTSLCCRTATHGACFCSRQHGRMVLQMLDDSGTSKSFTEPRQLPVSGSMAWPGTPASCRPAMSACVHSQGSLEVGAQALDPHTRKSIVKRASERSVSRPGRLRSP